MTPPALTDWEACSCHWWQPVCLQVWFGSSDPPWNFLLLLHEKNAIISGLPLLRPSGPGVPQEDDQSLYFHQSHLPKKWRSPDTCIVKYLLYFNHVQIVCVCECVHMWIQAPLETRSGCWISRSWSYRWLWAVQHGAGYQTQIPHTSSPCS